jgi:hypothetical protein
VIHGESELFVIHYIIRNYQQEPVQRIVGIPALCKKVYSVIMKVLAVPFIRNTQGLREALINLTPDLRSKFSIGFGPEVRNQRFFREALIKPGFSTQSTDFR